MNACALFADGIRDVFSVSGLFVAFFWIGALRHESCTKQVPGPSGPGAFAANLGDGSTLTIQDVDHA